ncbi:unnamed protein product, partial [Symbiodinium sp. KB8]
VSLTACWLPLALYLAYCFTQTLASAFAVSLAAREEVLRQTVLWGRGSEAQLQAAGG